MVLRDVRSASGPLEVSAWYPSELQWAEQPAWLTEYHAEDAAELEVESTTNMLILGYSEAMRGLSTQRYFLRNMPIETHRTVPRASFAACVASVAVVAFDAAAACQLLVLAAAESDAALWAPAG